MAAAREEGLGSPRGYKQILKEGPKSLQPDDGFNGLRKARDEFLQTFNRDIAIAYKHLSAAALENDVVKSYAHTTGKNGADVLKDMYLTSTFWSEKFGQSTDDHLQGHERPFNFLQNIGIIVPKITLGIPVPNFQNEKHREIFTNTLSKTCRFISASTFLSDESDIDRSNTTSSYLRLVEKFDQSLHPSIYLELDKETNKVIFSVLKFALYALVPDGAFAKFYSEQLEKAIENEKLEQENLEKDRQKQEGTPSPYPPYIASRLTQGSSSSGSPYAALSRIGDGGRS